MVFVHAPDTPQTVRYCCQIPANEVIPAHALDSDGEVDVTDIFCATCKGVTSSDDNDLILCDGPCNRCGCAVVCCVCAALCRTGKAGRDAEASSVLASVVRWTLCVFSGHITTPAHVLCHQPLLISARSCYCCCRRAFHEKCLDPPVVLADIPEDEGWLCPACDAKVCGCAVCCV